MDLDDKPRVRVWTDGPVGHIELDRPEVRNALDQQAADQLGRAVHDLQRRVRTIFISGSGGNFCAGADLKQVLTIRRDTAAVREYLEGLNRAFLAPQQATVPVIAVVEGFALAGGFELMQACDLVLVADDAVIGDQHSNFGLLPGAGGSQRLPRLVGRQRALGLLFSGEWLSGADAVAAGLAYRSFPATELRASAEEFGRRLAARSREGLSRMKALVNEGLGLPLQQGLALEIDTFCDYITGPDPEEGLLAFSARRSPHFA
jgi:enoyl-CoA hydratase/carnithine racemase